MTDVAPDGSPVLLYARLPSLGEAELIHEAVPAGSQILELGAGAGRVTHELLALGHEVVAVDNSREMLAFIRGAETVLGDMKTLNLEGRFPVVVRLRLRSWQRQSDLVSAEMDTWSMEKSSTTPSSRSC